MKFAVVIIALVSTLNLFAGTKVVIKTSMGNIELELYDKKSPLSVKNFLQYVDEGFYTNMLFHRVIEDYIIQGGLVDKDFKEKKTHPQIRNEALNLVPNLKGTIGMARRRPKHSAKSEFYINLKENPKLNHTGLGNYGFAVFGKVTKGLEIAAKIAKTPTEKKNNHKRVPIEPVIIKSIERLE